MEIVDRRVPLSGIGKTVGPAPVDRFIDNVRRHGIVVPVLLRETVSPDGEVQFAIVDGNRRIAAARQLGHSDVPARVLSGISSDDAARLTLAGNNFRSANDITEFWAIKHLERSGQARKRIAEDAGISEKYLGLRDRWSALDRRIFVGFAEGRIATTVANKISRMSPREQRELGDLFAQKGQVQTVDVERVARTRKPVRRVSANDMPSVPMYGSSPEQDPPVKILSVPVSPARGLPEVEADGSERMHIAMVSVGLRNAIEAVARIAVAEEIPLSDLTGVLAMAYREAVEAVDASGE